MITYNRGHCLEVLLDPDYFEDDLLRIKSIPVNYKHWGFRPRTKVWQFPATPGYLDRLQEISDDRDSFDDTCKPLEWPEYVPDANFRYHWKTAPWKHQPPAVQYLTSYPAALLHAHMGTGKTKVTLDTSFFQKHALTLIVCPKSVIPVWQSQIETHYPGDFVSVYALTGATKDRIADLDKAMRTRLDYPTICITNYDAVWLADFGKKILNTPWNLVVFDEIQRIKAHDGRASKFCAEIPAVQRIGLSGTPMPHSPLDIFGVYRALDCGVFGNSWTKFRDHYAVMGGYCVGNRPVQVLSYKNMDEFRHRLNKIRYEIKADVLDLPPIQTVDIPITLESPTRRHYDELKDEFMTEIRGGTVTVSNALTKLLRLQQVTSGYLPIETDDPYHNKPVEIGTEKYDALLDLLSGLREPVVVFARFRHDLAAICRAAKAAELGYYEISGERHELAEWNRATNAVIGVQVQAGGIGIDLTRASTAIVYSLGYSLGEYDQFIARLHRPGQQRNVYIYRLVCRDTVDRIIVKSIESKRNIIESILEEMKG